MEMGTYPQGLSYPVPFAVTDSFCFLLCHEVKNALHMFHIQNVESTHMPEPMEPYIIPAIGLESLQPWARINPSSLSISL